MTPSRQELLERAYELREHFDTIDESQGLSPFDGKCLAFIEDTIEELEGA